jgi:hypothetical protein
MFTGLYITKADIAFCFFYFGLLVSRQLVYCPREPYEYCSRSVRTVQYLAVRGESMRHSFGGKMEISVAKNRAEALSGILGITFRSHDPNSTVPYRRRRRRLSKYEPRDGRTVDRY